MGGFEKLIREFNNKIIIIAQTANGMERSRRCRSQQVVLIIFQTNQQNRITYTNAETF
jgi:hypothetical protein